MKSLVGVSILSKLQNSSLISRVLVILAFVIIGIFTIALSRAETAVLSVEAEGGTITGNAKPVNDSSASGGLAVQFGSNLSTACTTYPITNVDFPADSGIVNVKNAPYGAKGDGVTDDTAALSAAFNANDFRDGQTSPTLSTFAARTVYLPAGIYRITNSLLVTGSSLRIVGAGEDRTVIKLANSATGYSSASSPKYVLKTGTKMTTNQANSGFANHIQHLTIDVGSGNPGAVGVRFDAANTGSMNHVTVRSSDTNRVGSRGIAFETTPGPAMIRDVTVDGFDTGIYADKLMVNDLVMVNVMLRNQRQQGVLNDSKSLTFEKLTTVDVPIAIRTLTNLATTFLINSDLDGRGNGAAVQLAAGSFIYARDVRTSQFANIISVGSSVHFSNKTSLMEWSTDNFRRGNVSEVWTESSSYASIRLPINQPPDIWINDHTKWANVKDFGGTTGSSDVGPAFQRAIDSGAEVIYFPYGHYTLASAVTVRGNVKRVEFLFSELAGSNTGRINVATSSGTSVVLEHMASTVDVAQNGAGSLVVRHVGPISGTSGSVTLLTGPNAKGNVYLEDWGPHASVNVTMPVNIWARQMNREGTSWSINGGAKFWLLGDNVETDSGRGRPVVSISGSTFETIGGTWDNLGDNTSYGVTSAAIFQAKDSFISIVTPGLWRDGGFVGHWLTDTRGTTTVGNLTDSQLRKFSPRNADQRVVMPLYVSPNYQRPSSQAQDC